MKSSIFTIGAGSLEFIKNLDGISMSHIHHLAAAEIIQHEHNHPGLERRWMLNSEDGDWAQWDRENLTFLYIRGGLPQVMSNLGIFYAPQERVIDMGAAEAALQSLEERIDAIESEIGERNDSLQSDMDRLSKALGERNDSLQSDMDRLSKALDDLNAWNDSGSEIDVTSDIEEARQKLSDLREMLT